MEEIGVVESVDGAVAKVLIGRKRGCCELYDKGACDIPADGIVTEAVNLARAKAGQKVKITMKSYTYIKGAFILYVLPVSALFLGAILGKVYLPGFVNGVDSELLAALGGFLAFLASLILVKALSVRMDRRTENKSVIVKILE